MDCCACLLLLNILHVLNWRLDSITILLLLSLCTGVKRVFFGSDFVTVTKSDDASWDILKPEIFAAIMDFYTSGQPLFLDENAAAAKDTAIHDVCAWFFHFLLVCVFAIDSRWSYVHKSNFFLYI